MGLTRKIIDLLKPLVDSTAITAFAFRYLRDSRKLSHHAKFTKFGFKFIGNESMEAGDYEPEETEIIRHLLRKVDVFINIGANIGYYLCIAMNAGVKCVAFEPDDLNLKYLYKNLRANRWDDKVEIFPLALSNRIGIAEIYGGGTGASLIKGWAGVSDKMKKHVPTNTLDNILGDRFSNKDCLILVDIEGSEMMMLESAKKFLKRSPLPIWIVEINISEHQPRGIKINPNLTKIFQMFWDNGYSALTAGKQLKEVKPDEIKKIADQNIDSMKTHNFIFIERDRMESFRIEIQ